MAQLALSSVPLTGGASIEDATVAAAPGGDTAACGPHRFLYVANGDDAQHTVTVATPGTVKGLAIGDATLVVPAGESGILPLPRLFAGANGRAAISYDAVTDLTVAVFELGT